MRTMSAETEPRVCEEDFGSDEGDVESYLEEEDNSSELLDRLRELEAENSALMLANESQREAYERCLDEVANHVVQALLNQKDLREECIKLKMLVFDLERQNRALCELFQQKLPCQSTAPYQVQPGPLPEYNSQLYNDSAKQVETALTEAQTKGNAFRPQHASPGPRGPAASMEALSPFFKKKAHILEVLRKMEETDPLKFHPSSAGLSFCDYSQVLMSSEAVLAGGELTVPCKSQLAHCRCSCSEADKQPHVNGDVTLVTCEGCRTCSASCRKSVESPAKCNHVCSPAKAGIAQIHTTAPSECHINSTTVETGLPVKQPAAKEHQQPGGPYLSITSTDPNTADPSLEDCHAVSGSKVTDTDDAQNPEEDDLQGGRSDEGPPLHPLPGDNSTIQMTYCEMETRVLTHNILLTSSDACSSALREASVPEKDGSNQEAPCGRANVLVSPSPSCLSEVKAAAISSPSKLLKFLKIPSIGERTQSSSPVRLSPQLTRTSRIPCRTNNYEVYHSPVPTRRATTTERCRQPPPPPARSESYPATHSAPTSPPQAEEPCPPPGNSSLPSPKVSRASRLGPAAPSTSASSPRAFQRVPHYENVPELSTSSQQRGLGSCDSRTTLPSQTKPGGGDRKLVKSLPEGSIVGTPYQQHPSSSSSSSSSTDSSSEQDVDVESPAWHSQHSLSNNSGLHRPQGSHSANYTRTQNRALDTEERESIIVNPSISQAPLPPKRNDPSSIPKRPGTVRQPVESSHHTFKDRLAALGKLRSSEDLQVGLQPSDAADTMLSNESSVTCGDERSRIAEKPLDHHVEEQKHSKHTDCLDGRPKGHFPVGGLKLPGASLSHDSGAKLLPSGPSGAKPEHDVVSSRVAVAKTDSPKSKLGLLSPNTDTPQVLRNNMKCPGSLNLSYNSKPGPGSHSSVGPSPSKVPPKSPSKPCQTPAVRMGKPSEAPRYSSKSEERSKIGGNKKKNLAYGDSLPPPPPRPPADAGEKPPPVPSPQSAIEQKVMKGIEENMLKEQDRGAQPPEVKQKASNGIASWFALKKSKLPALSRKAEGPKTKEEKREWKINIPSVGKDSKVATRCKEGVEGLNISTLMEKAEGLRRALEEERAYVERSGRGHSCEVVMDQAQGQLAVMYRGGRSDNFMQQLLNRVDGKDVVPSFPQRRLSFDCKTSRPVFNQQSDGSISHTTSREDMEKGSDLMSNVTSDEILADPVHSQHFASSGASTYTLDSGIGTFPLPDCSSGAAGRSLSKARAGADSQAMGSPGRANRRSRTLDRDMSTLEECYPAHRQLIPTIQYSSGLEGKSPSLMQTAGVIHEDKETYGAHMFTPRSKTWTFPSLKNPAGSADVYLAVEEEEEPAPYGSPFRGSVKPCGPAASRAPIDPSSLPVPAQTGLSRRGKTRTPSVPEMSREAGLELLRERPEEALSPSRPQVLETPESLSDSLYDSLSSCGSQG